LAGNIPISTKVGVTQGQPYSSVVFIELGMWYHASKGPFLVLLPLVFVALQLDQRADLSREKIF